MKKIDLKMRIKDFDFGNANGTIQLRLEHPFPLTKKFVTMLDLVTSHKDDLLRIKCFGRQTLMRLEDKLLDYDLWLGMTAREVNEYQGEKIVSEMEEKDERAFTKDLDKQMLEVFAKIIERAKENAVNQCLTKKEWEDRVFRAALEIELELIRNGERRSEAWDMEQYAADKAVRLMQKVRFKLCQREE